MDLICYLSNGYPSIESSKQMARNYVDAGCDIIEIDFPAREPYLESPYLADRMAKALEVCGDYNRYMAAMAGIKRGLPSTRFILLAYEATVLEIGCEAFISFCRENDFTDMILVGLRDDAVKNRLIAAGIRVSCYVQFHMPADQIASAKASNSFVYMQGKPDKGQVSSAFPTLKDCIAHLRAQGIDRPIYCGVGIHSPADVEMAKKSGADGVFVGSAILKLQEDLSAMQDMIRLFKAAC